MQLLKGHVQPLVERAIASLGVDPGLVERLLQPARELEQGDLTLPCFPFAKALGKSPADIAEDVCEAMESHPALQEIHAVNGYASIG